MPLDRNNRILVQEGLRRLRARAATTGLMALARVAGCRMDEMSARQLGHQIAPRLNAAGRIDDMAVGIRCLLTDDPAEALTLAGELDRLNRERRELEARMREQALIRRAQPAHLGRASCRRDSRCSIRAGTRASSGSWPRA